MDEINRLCELYKGDYKYLFSFEPISPATA